VIGLEVEVFNLTKVYEGGVVALSNVSFSHRRGSVLAVIGPNGAGKTTLLRVLSGQLKPSSGVVKLLGYDVVREFDKVKSLIAYLPQDIRLFFYPLTPRDYITSYLLMRGYSLSDARRRAREVIEDFDIEDVANTHVARLSGGTVRRMFLAMIFAADDAEVYFLDEAFVGLDPRARVNAWNIVRKVARSGKLVVLASHYMDDVSAVADRVLMLNRGRIIADGGVRELLDKVLGGVKRKIVIKESQVQLKELIEAIGKDHVIVRTIGDMTFIYTDNIGVATSILSNYGVRFEVNPVGLEDVVIVLGGVDEKS
jgi:ABC-2 type transport system ATP-binding protein